jgi:hypothetical protein
MAATAIRTRRKRARFRKSVAIRSTRTFPGPSLSFSRPVCLRTAASRVAAALRMAAVSLRHSDTALGAYYRQIGRRIGADVAVFATARKLATLIYRLLRWGQPYVDEGVEVSEKRHQQVRIQRLTAMATNLGYQLTPQVESRQDRGRTELRWRHGGIPRSTRAILPPLRSQGRWHITRLRNSTRPPNPSRPRVGQLAGAITPIPVKPTRTSASPTVCDPVR